MDRLEIRIAQANRIIKEMAFASTDPEQCAVACSFGKDSTVVLDLVRKICPTIKVVFCNTTIELPETLRFRDRMVKEWDLNYYEAHPEPGITFPGLVKKYGLPGIRLQGKNRVPMCCQLLKDKPADLLYDQLGIKCIFTGLTAAESHNRAMLMHRPGCGEYYFAKTQGRYKAHPIMSWTEADVWAYHERFKIPHNEAYDKDRSFRVGCGPCTAHGYWMEVMPIQAPGWYKWVQKHRGQQLICPMEE